VTMTLTEQIKTRIQRQKEGWCFTQSDFVDLGKYDAVRKILSRLHDIGYIKRLTKGIYYLPRYHPTLGELPVQIDAVINAMQRAYRIRCQPSGAYAANLLGISEQVPAKIIILTDGASKQINIGNKVIIFKKTTPKNMVTAGSITGLVIQAIKFIGKEHINGDHIALLKQRLSSDDMKTLKRHAFLAPAWIAKLINTELIG
jgi:predicted transcriptional regulator of viral defense system